MKNKIVIKTKDNKEEYKLILKVEIDDIIYIIYTLNEKNDCGDIICYASSYDEIDGQQVLNYIEDEYIIELLDSILIQVQNLMNKKEV